MDIDIKISMYNTVNEGLDPDSYSMLLAEYHQYLWSKEISNDQKLHLEFSKGLPYRLYDRNKNINVSSDSIIHSYSKWKSMKNIIDEVHEYDIDRFIKLGSTIGAYIVFPSNRVLNKPTINAARGMNNKIKDRFDLTLECIRLYYLNIESPLSEVICRYGDFFSLFCNFKGYVNFFLLNDLVDDCYNVKFWLEFKDFDNYVVLPRNKEEYYLFMNRSLSFVKSRNERILIWNQKIKNN